MKFESWFSTMEEELSIKWAELGKDYELDANWDEWIEREYEAYLNRLQLNS